MKRLQVWHHATHVGTLSINNEGRWRFAYDSAWTLFALSPYLPITGAVNDLAHQRTVEWFFDNLLPEGALRTALAKREALSEKDSWGLLSQYGKDTAGALSVLPDAISPNDKQEYTEIPQDQLAAMIDSSKAGTPLMGQGKRPRMSLPGAQEKIALRMDESGTFSMPEGTSPSTHILKPESINTNYPFCPANEWFCMSLAGQTGLKAPEVHVLSVGTHRVYVVKRFDRVLRASGEIFRLHQIDLCQALNVPPSKKYEDEGGLTAKDLFKVTTACRIPAAARSTSLQWIAFNYIIGNSDAHAKNLSLMMSGYKPEISPAYDLVCVDAYHQDRRLTMTIGGQIDAGWIEGCHWDALALENRIDPRAMRTVLARMIADVRKAQDTILQSESLLNAEKEWLREHVLPVIDQRVAFVETALAQPVCTAKTIQEKHGSVPDNILQTILEQSSAPGRSAFSASPQATH